MLGTKPTEVFASRWKALRWSLGVLLLAYCTVPSAEINADVALSPKMPALTATKPATDQSADDAGRIYKDYAAKLKALKVFEPQ